MSAAAPAKSALSPLGHALLLASGTAALMMAAAVVVPSAQHFVQLQGTKVPTFFAQAFLISSLAFDALVPIAITGAVFFFIAILRLGSPRLVIVARMALAILSGVACILTLYLLTSAGIAYKLASLNQMTECDLYKGTLDQFALLESAHGRYEELRQKWTKNRGIRMVEVSSASEFGDEEVRKRASALMGAMAMASDTAAKRRLLATLALFRDRIHNDSYYVDDLPRHAKEAGVPNTTSHFATLGWIATNLHRDGWEPLPLFKFSK